MSRVELYVDGSYLERLPGRREQSSGGGWVIKAPGKELMGQGVKFTKHKNSNEAETMAMLHGIRAVVENGLTDYHLVVHTDCVQPYGHITVGRRLDPKRRMYQVVEEIYEMLSLFPSYNLVLSTRNNPMLELCDMMAIAAAKGDESYDLQRALRRQSELNKSWEARIKWRKENGLPADKGYRKATR